MAEQKKKIIPIIIKCILGVILAIVLLWCGCVAVIGIKEYKPEPVEKVEITGNASKTVVVGDQISVITWNVGYGALGDNADFFMDGGKGVNTATKARLDENIAGCIDVILDENPDVLLLQEVDRDSKRSHHVDEVAVIAEALGTDKYESAFAINYNVLYVPFPLPTIGKVFGGINTYSAFDITDSERISLPCPFGFPMRYAQLKRCVDVNRIPIEGSDKELVIVNLHLEAYDSGEGKIAQTAMLKEILEAEANAGNYVVAGGDFNQVFSNTDWSMYPVISEDMWAPGYIDVSEFKGLTFLSDNSAPTCRSLDKPYAGASKENFQYYMLDGFIVSDNIQVDEFRTVNLDFKNSDHNPVALKITLK